MKFSKELICVFIVLGVAVISAVAVKQLDGKNESFSEKITASDTHSDESREEKTASRPSRTTVTTKKSKSETAKAKTQTTKTTRTQTKISVSFPKDINKVTAKELTFIDGIGEVTAKKIIDYRKKIGGYSNLRQLMEISGIGESTYEMLKSFLYVTPDKYREMTTSRKVTSFKAKSSPTPAKTTEKKFMRMVNINTADQKELEDCLLISSETAWAICDGREQIGGIFENKLELLHFISLEDYNKIKNYVTVE